MKHDEFVQLERLNKQYVQLEQKENYEIQKVFNHLSMVI